MLGTFFVVIFALLPVQKALKIVASWPWYPDTLAMSNTLASKYNAPSARVLLDMDSIPPLLTPHLEDPEALHGIFGDMAE